MPYAIIKTGGKQFRVEAGRTYKVPSRVGTGGPHPVELRPGRVEVDERDVELVGEAGGTIEFNDVLMGNDGNNVRTGVPSLSGAKVTGEIVRHGRGEKIIVFKQKRRKNYARKRGHRQGFTEVRINEISLG